MYCGLDFLAIPALKICTGNYVQRCIQTPNDEIKIQKQTRNSFFFFSPEKQYKLFH